jgi:hypothetical protein
MRKSMSVTPDFVKKELVKLEKKTKANETTRKEAYDALEKAKEVRIALQREEIALRTLAAGEVPKATRVGFAQQLADALKVAFDETSIMEIITKYEKQDKYKADEVTPTNSIDVPDTPTESVEADAPVVTTTSASKKRGRPKLSDAEKATRAKARALAAVATAPLAEEKEQEPDDDDYFDPDDYGDESTTPA